MIDKTNNIIISKLSSGNIFANIFSVDKNKVKKWEKLNYNNKQEVISIRLIDSGKIK